MIRRTGQGAADDGKGGRAAPGTPAPGRAPEAEMPDSDAARQALAANHAFLNRHTLAPPLAVETEATPEQLARLVARIEASWARFGRTEPYWSVLSNPAFRAQRIEETGADFFRTGRTALRRVAASVARAGAELAPGARVLDYGCGVGRVSAAFAEAGFRVTAVDISAEHLALAAEHCKGMGIDFRRIERLAEIDALPEVDLFFSTIVLQHNPPPVIAEILSRSLRRVAPGGVAWFQVPTYLTGYSYDIAEDLAGAGEGRMELHVLPQAAVYRLMAETGFTPLETRFNDAVGNPACESTVFLARRTAPRDPLA